MDGGLCVHIVKQLPQQVRRHGVEGLLVSLPLGLVPHQLSHTAQHRAEDDHHDAAAEQNAHADERRAQHQKESAGQPAAPASLQRLCQLPVIHSYVLFCHLVLPIPPRR